MMKSPLHNDCRAGSPQGFPPFVARSLRRPLSSVFCLLSPRRSAFSLIEIVVALAVISIGLIAVVGLIPQGLQASRDAADSTLAATIVHDTLNELRVQALNAWPPTLPSASYPNYPDIYYDGAGTNQVASPSSPSRYFRVHIMTVTLSATLVTSMATVTWPDKGVIVPALNTNYFYTTIANYQH